MHLPFSHENHHWAYVWIPVFGAFIWFGTLISMLITWLATGRPRYPSQDGNIAYISDVGASYLKPLFVTGCCITAVCFVLSLIIERVLRHSGRLIPSMRRREHVLGWLSVTGSAIGGIGLILLSVLDTERHPHLHRVFLLVFMIGVALSAIFTIIEYRWISEDFDYFKSLKIAYFAKAIIATLLIILAIGFGCTFFNNGDAGGILEWIIAVGFTLYLLTFAYDLWQSKDMHEGQLTVDRLAAEGYIPRHGRARHAYANGNGNGVANGSGNASPDGERSVNGDAGDIAMRQV